MNPASLRGYRKPRIDDALDTVGLTDVADDRPADPPAPARAGRTGQRPRRRRYPPRSPRARSPRGRASVVLSSHRMDDLTALCTEVSLLARGRVVFSGPVSKLAAETGEINYRLRTSDSAAARRLADGTPVATLYGTLLPH